MLSLLPKTGYDDTFKFWQVPDSDSGLKVGLLNLQAKRLLTFINTETLEVGSKAVEVFHGMTVDTADAFTVVHLVDEGAKLCSSKCHSASQMTNCHASKNFSP